MVTLKYMKCTENLSNISAKEMVLIVEVVLDTLHGQRYFRRCLLSGQFHVIRPHTAEHSDSHKVDDFDETNDGRTEAQTERTANIRYTHKRPETIRKHQLQRLK